MPSWREDCHISLLFRWQLSYIVGCQPDISMMPPYDTPTPIPPSKSPAFNGAEFQEAFAFLFRRANSVGRIWWVPLICFVPLFGVLAVKGWRLDIIRRRMSGQAELAPDPMDIGRFLADGWWLCVVFVLYHIPLVMVMIISFQSTLENVLDLIHWASTELFSSESHGLSKFVVLIQLGMGIVGKLLVPLLYYYLLKPVIYAGLLRYAVTGRHRSLVNVPAQVKSVLGNLEGFMKVCLFDTVAAMVINLFSAVVLSSVIGAVLIPVFSIPMYNAASGYMLGGLGRKLYPGAASGARTLVD